jgi:nucleoside phosphorylase
VNEAVEQDRKVIGVEMGGNAVMRAAKHTSAPLDTIILRSVANYADKQSTYHLDFAEHPKLAEVAAFLLNIGVCDLVTRCK